MDTERRVFTIPEAGRLLGLSRSSAYDAARRGEIPTLRIGRRVLVPRERLEQLLRGETAPTARSGAR
jgi:excisionase family DNA binding protein